MANAAAEWKRMHDPDAMKVFPYVRYHARNDARTRSDHGDLDGKIFHKDDPFLKTHTPPWEFNCRCWLEEITAKEAGKEPDLIQEKTPADKVTVDSRSGFSFDPEHVFEKFELESIKSPEVRGQIREDAEMQLGDQVSFSGDNEKAHIKTNSVYVSFEEKKLKSCKEWDVTNLPKYPELQSPNDAREKLVKGIKVEDPDGQEIMFGQKVLDHWKIKHKTEEDINGRLKRLNLGLETVKHPSEIWEQDTQTGYVQVFNNESGKQKGCLVFVDHEGQAITYFPKDLKELDEARKGISVKTLPALDAKQTAPKKELPHLAPTLNHKKYTPVPEKVKEENEETWKNVSDSQILMRNAIASSLRNRGIDVDENGLVTLYHTTIPENYEKIQKTGFHGTQAPIGCGVAEEIGERSFFGFDRDWVENTWGGQGMRTIEIKIPAEYIRQGAGNEKEVYIEGNIKPIGSVWIPDRLPTSTFYDRTAIKRFLKKLNK